MLRPFCLWSSLGFWTERKSWERVKYCTCANMHEGERVWNRTGEREKSRNIWVGDSCSGDGRLFRSAGRCSVGRDVKEEYNPITLVINLNLLFTAEAAGRDVDLPIIVWTTPFLLALTGTFTIWFIDRKQLPVVFEWIWLSLISCDTDVRCWHTWEIQRKERCYLKQKEIFFCRIYKEMCQTGL